MINANEAQNGNTECSSQPRRGVVAFRGREGSNWQSLALLSSEKPRATLPLNPKAVATLLVAEVVQLLSQSGRNLALEYFRRDEAFEKGAQKGRTLKLGY